MRNLDVRSLSLEFENNRGIPLSAILDLPPSGSSDIFAVFAHCFTCSKNYKGITYISKSLAEQGIGVLRFDFTGLGQSGGRFSSSSFGTNIEDLEAACRFLERDYRFPELLIGHSMGGAAALSFAVREERISSVVTIAAPYTLTGLLRRLLGDERELPAQAVKVLIGGREFWLEPEFFQSLKRYSLPEIIRELQKPVLIFHSPADRVVNYDQALEILKATQPYSSLITVPAGDHLVTDTTLALRIAHLIGWWLKLQR